VPLEEAGEQGLVGVRVERSARVHLPLLADAPLAVADLELVHELLRAAARAEVAPRGDARVEPDLERLRDDAAVHERERGRRRVLLEAVRRLVGAGPDVVL